MLIQTDESAREVGLDDAVAPRPRSRGASLARAILQAAVMLAVLAAGYTLMTMLIDARPARTPRVIEPTVYAIEAAAVERGDIRPTIRLYGDVEAARSIDLRAEVTGEIVEAGEGLSAGSRVSAGDLIARIDPFVYEGGVTEAEANLAQARAALSEIEARIAAGREQIEAAELQLELAESDLERARSLGDRGAATAQQIDERRLVVSQRRQAVSQASNDLMVQQAQREQQEAAIDRLTWLLRQAERNLAATEVRAPFAGVVTESTVEPGRQAGASDVLASIYDDSRLEVRFTLSDAQYGRISADPDALAGRPVEINWSVGGATYVYDGTIDRIGATVASDRGGIEVVARLQPADYPVQLRPGAFVEVAVPDRLYSDSIMLPESAVYDSDHVFVVEDGTLHRREVEVLAYQGDDVVLDGDLAGGETVMSTRLTEADEGVAVRIAGTISDEEQEALDSALEGEEEGARAPGERRRFGGRRAMRGLGG